MTLALIVAAAGGVGAVARYVVDNLVRSRHRGTFPLGTLLINVTGSLILGLLTGLMWHHGLSAHQRLIVGTGFCGGLTTWSTASWESVQLVEDRLYVQATAYTLGGLAVALGAAAAGLALATL